MIDPIYLKDGESFKVPEGWFLWRIGLYGGNEIPVELYDQTRCIEQAYGQGVSDLPAPIKAKELSVKEGSVMLCFEEAEIKE